MHKYYLKFNFSVNKVAFLVFLFPWLFCATTSAQYFGTEEFTRCIAVESEQARLNDKYEEYFERFEAYIEAQKGNLNAESNNNYTVPVIFHIIHDNDAVGSGDNIATQYINSQLDQINNDFRKILGTSGNGGGVDTGIEFCAATVDENGVMLSEPGINRIDRNDEGWLAPPYGTPVGGCFFGVNLDYIDNTIKPQSQWDPEQYLNIWVLDMVCGILGYAQFPEAAALPGIGTGNGAASSDGVVVLPGSVGSTDNPLPPSAGGATPYNQGRTLTHEIGHFFGLRHIWGDGSCSVDDFCDDTPNANGSTSGCPSNKDTCPGDGPDQIENYMDYTDDICMERFTQDQTDRMQIVMGATGEGSPRREILASSTACGSTMSSFTITATNSPLTTTPPNDATFSFDVAFLGGFSSTVNLSVVGLPAGLNATFSNNPITSAGTYTLTISGTANVALGTYNFSIEGNGGGLNDSAPVVLIVEEESDCTTLVSTDVPVDIPNQTTISSQIVVSDFGAVTDINVLFRGDHDRVRDLSFELRSPTGTTIQLIDVDDPCDGGANDFDLGFDDQSSLTISGDLPCPPTDGRIYQPDQTLSAFDGEEVNGTWTLLITDVRSSDDGQLNYWELEYCIDSGNVDCSTDLMIDDIPIDGNTYSASNTITSAGTVAADSVVVFEAGASITLKENFIAENGSTFTARIQNCVATIDNNGVEVRSKAIKPKAAVSNELSVFPNPFSEQTTVQIDIEQERSVHIQLMDMRGRMVANILQSNALLAGTHQYEIDASTLNPGIYILLVRIGNQLQTKKLSVVRR